MTQFDFTAFRFYITAKTYDKSNTGWFDLVCNAKTSNSNAPGSAH